MFKKIIYLILMTELSAGLIAYAVPGISAKGAVLMDSESGAVIYEKNSNEKMKPASTTKILTGIIAIESTQPEDIISVSRNAAYTEGSSMYLKEDEKIKAENVIYGLMLNSGNDAAVALAEHISGDLKGFGNLMNKKAAQIGAVNSNFVNPSGLDDEMHYTTPYDLALISSYAMKNPHFRKIVSTVNKIVDNEAGEKKYLHNHNKLLNMYEGCNGIKTGFTKASGRTLVSSAERDGMELIAVTMNAPDDWNDHISLLNYGFNNFETICFLRKDSVCIDVAVDGGKKEFVGLYPAEELKKTVKKGEAENFSLEFEAEKTPAPVTAGVIGGYALLKEKGKEQMRIPLLYAENIEAVNVKPDFREIFESMLSKVFY